MYTNIDCENSLFLLNKNETIRKIIYKVVLSSYFDNFIMFLILLNCFKLIFDTYINFESETKMNRIFSRISHDMDLVFNIIFIFEALLKILALGFIMDKGSYLRENWNQLDFFIVIISLIDMCFEGIQIPAIKVLFFIKYNM